MKEDLFSISIKGILQYNGYYLLRKNQRKEYELLGGRLEYSDPSLQRRLCTEFLEESGILVHNLAPREPWLYIIGSNNVIVLPYLCSAYHDHIPDKVHDLDGGELHWISTDTLNSISLPIGYYDSILGKVPRKTYSPYVKKYLKIIPGYKECLFRIRVNLYDVYHNKIFKAYLNHYESPRELIKLKLGNKYSSENIFSMETEFESDVINVNYVLVEVK